VKQCMYEGHSEEIYNAVAGSIFIRLAVAASKICEIPRDSLKNSN